MYSLLITVESIRLEGSLVPLSQMKQYQDEVEVRFDHGEDYRIPSLIWPPPSLIAEKIEIREEEK